MKPYLFNLFMITIFVACSSQAKDQALIRECYNNYKNHLAHGNGIEAVNLLDSRSIEYYNTILDLVKTSDSLEIESLPIFDKYMVLSIRGLLSRELILNADGKDLLIAAIDKELIGPVNQGEIVIGDIIVENGTAKGNFVVENTETPNFLVFRKENGEWKYDLTSSFDIAVPYLESLVEQMGEQYLLGSLLALPALKETDINIWKPVE